MGVADDPRLNGFTNPSGGDSFSHHVQAKDSDFFLAPAESIRTNDDSGVYSPPLWKGKGSPRRRIRDLSPASRIQAVDRGQRELMDMVRNMPEASYELSLTDLVEIRRHQPMAEEIKDTKSKNVRCDSRKAQMKRSGSQDNGGFLLKMVCPIGILRSRKEMDPENSNRNACAKVSPNPLRTTSSSDGYRKGREKRSDSSRGSQSSSTFSSVKNNARQLGGCWTFFCRGTGRQSKQYKVK